MREDKLTTKIRVVFNASCRFSNGKSFNEALHIGAKLQRDLLSLMLSWRLHQFVLMADLAKMYRLICVAFHDTRYHQILRHDYSHDELKAHRLLTVTFGMTCALFLAIRVLKQLAADERHWFLLAASIIESDFYVDDALFGNSDKTSLMRKRDELIEALAASGLRARKWVGNSPNFLDSLPFEDHGLAVSHDLTEHDHLKVLGIQWQPLHDAFTFAGIMPTYTTLTKRSFLSILARLYDPLGWLAPHVVVGKIVVQLLWFRKLDWNDSLPADLYEQASQFIDGLNKVSDVSLKRWVGFGDASEKI